jgi:hypothetical protein
MGKKLEREVDVEVPADMMDSGEERDTVVGDERKGKGATSRRQLTVTPYYRGVKLSRTCTCRWLWTSGFLSEVHVLSLHLSM